MARGSRHTRRNRESWRRAHCFSPRPAAKRFPPEPTTNPGSGQPRLIAQVAKLIEAGEIADAATLIVYDRFCLIPR